MTVAKSLFALAVTIVLGCAFWFGVMLILWGDFLWFSILVVIVMFVVALALFYRSVIRDERERHEMMISAMHRSEEEKRVDEANHF